MWDRSLASVVRQRVTDRRTEHSSVIPRSRHQKSSWPVMYQGLGQPLLSHVRPGPGEQGGRYEETSGREGPSPLGTQGLTRPEEVDWLRGVPVRPGKRRGALRRNRPSGARRRPGPVLEGARYGG